MDSETLFGGIEAGGTKFICAIASGPERIASELRIPTTTPEETFRHVIDFFRPAAADKSIVSIGVGSFGPVDLDPASRSYGFITSTTKPGWRDTDFAGRLQRE